MLGEVVGMEEAAGSVVEQEGEEVVVPQVWSVVVPEDEWEAVESALEERVLEVAASVGSAQEASE
jgi:hypothetical protein